MIIRVYSAAVSGIRSKKIEIEMELLPKEARTGREPFSLSITGGVPAARSSGIGETANRIRIAFRSTALELPTVKASANITPSSERVPYNTIELALAVSILRAMKVVTVSDDFIEECLFVGELSFDGRVQKMSAVFPLACDAFSNGFKRVIVPKGNAKECALVDNIEVIGVETVAHLIEYLKNPRSIKRAVSVKKTDKEEWAIDFFEVKGQEKAKRVMQISAAGGHNVIMYGSPGSGKSMLAHRLPTILSPLDHEEIIEKQRIFSTGKEAAGYSSKRPFRYPHHTLTQTALIGGGKTIRPGEISLAHKGVLFLDEFPEINPEIIETMRQPMENGTVTLSRNGEFVEIPSEFTLIAAMNPCPCGFTGDTSKTCTCIHHSVKRYLSRISGPIIDRIDLQIHIPTVEIGQSAHEKCSSSQDLRIGVNKAIENQVKRFGKSKFNARMTPGEIDKYCHMTPSAKNLLAVMVEKSRITMRSHSKIIKISRTIADIEGVDMIEESHVKEAFQYRGFDKFLERYRG